MEHRAMKAEAEPNSAPPEPHPAEIVQMGLADILAQGSGLTPDTAKAEIVKTLMDDAHLEKATELSSREVFVLAALKAQAKAMHCDVANDFALDYMRLKVSHMRQGRRESIEIGKPPAMPGMGGMNGAPGQRPWWKFW